MFVRLCDLQLNLIEVDEITRFLHDGAQSAGDEASSHYHESMFYICYFSVHTHTRV